MRALLQGYTGLVPPLRFPDARSLVLREVRAAAVPPAVETVSLLDAAGRVLAADAVADRDYPPFNRAMRDGFAVRFDDLPGTVRLIGEVRAGEVWEGIVGAGEAVEIMTGAPVPAGANAVVMVEHCTRGEDGTISCTQEIGDGGNVTAAGSEAKAGSAAIAAGTRIDHTVIAWLASIGTTSVPVFARLRVAIIATGDELVGVEETPLPHQIRDSNTYALAAQIARAGAIPVIIAVARDTVEATRTCIEKGLEADLVLLSGGVSAGKYDVVEIVLAELGATFFFDRVLIQPGAPLVFGKVRDKFFFGLPGNPGSTMMTFELFARAAIDLLSGCKDAPLPMTLGRLTHEFKHKAGLTRFLPSYIACGEVTPVASKGSGDVPAIARNNGFLVADAEKTEYAAGELIPVLLK